MKSILIDVLAISIAIIGVYEVFTSGCDCHVLKSLTTALAIVALNRKSIKSTD